MAAVAAAVKEALDEIREKNQESPQDSNTRRRLVAASMQASQKALKAKTEVIGTNPVSRAVPFIGANDTDIVSNMFSTWLMFFDSWIRITQREICLC